MLDFIAMFGPVVALLALALGGLALLSGKQVKDYKKYLEQHTTETKRQTDNQREMIEAQVAATDRQTNVLKRIAEVLERRG